MPEPERPWWVEVAGLILTALFYYDTASGGEVRRWIEGLFDTLPIIHREEVYGVAAEATRILKEESERAQPGQA